MDHKEKVEKMLQEFTKGKLTKFALAPPIHRLLWKCGIKIAPPLFATFLSLFVFYVLFMGILLAIIFTEIKGLIYGVDRKDFSGNLIVTIGIMIFVAISYRIKAKRFDLPLWKDYLKNEDEGSRAGRP